MSFGFTAATWLAVSAGVAAVGVGASIYGQQQARSSQNKANDQAQANALLTQQQSDEANNRANAKSPDVTAAMSAAALASQSGQSGTMLTGPGGVDPSSLTLGKNALLGG